MIINNKQVSTRFGMLSVEIFLKKAVNANTSASSAFGVASMIWAGIVNYYEVKELAIPVTFEEVYDYVESEMLSDSEMKEILELTKEFNDSKALKHQTDKMDLKEIDVKKKKRTSEKSPTKQG